MLLRLALTYCLVITMSSCSSLNGTRAEKWFGKDANLITMAYDISDDLVKGAHPPLVKRHPEQPVLTSTFVDNNDLEQTSHFSRVLQEHMTSRFVQHGYTVREIKLRNQLHIQPKKGESILSRDLQHINNSQKAQAIMMGTYSYRDRTMYISARLVDPITANILSTADYRFLMDNNVLAMFGLKISQDTGMEMIEQPSESFLNSVFY